MLWRLFFVALALRPVVGKEFPLAEAAQALHAVMDLGTFGRIVLVLEK
jgi:NADPH:quinone reductase-like Zn-dependent oxidoreductase